MGACCLTNDNELQIIVYQLPARPKFARANEICQFKLKCNEPSQQITQRVGNKSIDCNTLSSSNKKSANDNDSTQLQEKSVDTILKQAEQKATAKQYKLSEKLYGIALEKLQSTKQKSIQVYQQIAFCNLNLINLILLSNQKRDIQQYAKGALQIYDSNEGIYYQQKIVLLNSISLHLQKNGKLKEAIQTQKQILSLQQMYYPKNDQRKLLTSNNIACYYYQNGQQKQGNLLFIDLLKLVGKNDEIRNVIKANHQFYLNKSTQKA